MLYAKAAIVFLVVAFLVYTHVSVYNYGRKEVLQQIAETSLVNQEASNDIFNKQQVKSKKQLCLDLSGGDVDACVGLPN